jgi:hypothetical protein
VIAELIIILPLKSKNIITLSRSGQFIRPLINCLTLNDPNYSTRAIRTLDIIFSHSSYEEIDQLLSGLKDTLIAILVDLIRQSRLSEIKNENDMTSYSLKLLAKMGAIHRLHPDQPQLRTPLREPETPLRLRDIDPEAPLDLDMLEVVHCAIDIFRRVLDTKYQSQLLVVQFETY